MIIQILITILLVLHSCQAAKDERAGREFMRWLNAAHAAHKHKTQLANWAYITNITKENLDAKIKVDSEAAKFGKEQWQKVLTYPWESYKDKNLRTQFQMYSFAGNYLLSEDKFERLTEIVGKMQSIYSTAKICSFSDETKCDLALEPDIEDIFKYSNDPEELKYVWRAWRNASGKKLRRLYEEYVVISNEAAVLNGLHDASDRWIYSYGEPHFEEDIKNIWLQVRPLYLQIHAYVRNKLRQYYGDNIVQKDGYIPAHLLGCMWAQQWSSVYKTMIPYPDVESTDVTSEMVAQGYTVKKMYKTVEEFFMSINMSAMTEDFWRKSILEKPKGREMDCHAAALDFYNAKDFRIKHCSVVGQSQFYTAHHEMGHIEYYMSYKNQPLIYRNGANAGFHEAVGDVIALSVSTDKHLHKLGLLKNYVDSYEATINKLFETSLSKVAMLPSAYIVDLWRWYVFKGAITPENYNAAWWDLKNKYQGVEAPVRRSEHDFDPGSKFHIAANVPYIRYFVSYIIQFQFHKALCRIAGQYEPNNPRKPLHKCDIHGSTAAGNALKKMLEMGSSKSWQDAMESLTGERSIDPSALLEYFAPLQEWLTKENQRTGEYIGWR